MTPTRTYHRGQHRSQGDIAPCCTPRLDENTRTHLHPRVLEVRGLHRIGFLNCGGYLCADGATFQVNQVPLCRDHATKRVARRMWDLSIAALIDHFGEFDFVEAIPDDEAVA